MSEKEKNGEEIQGDNQGDAQLFVKDRPETKEPDLYRIFMLNDDFTPMDFVVHVLKVFFKKNQEDAIRIMYDIHNKGSGIVGVYPFDVAQTKVYQVNAYAQQNQVPLLTQFEKE